MGNQNLKMRDVNDNPDKLSAEKTITSDMFETAQSPDEIHHQKTTSTLTELDLVYNDFIGEKKGNITDDYSLLSPPIGKGSFGEVRRAIHKKTNITRAVKIIYKDSTDPDERKNLINEINILKKLDHPNIMKIFEFYQDSSHLYLVTEYFNGGELFDRISKDKSFSERQAAITMKQILSAVSYCHAHNIVHRDIKPENILYESNRSDTVIKIIDFGTSRFYDPTVRMDQRFGTPYYIAPEVLKKDYTEKCDVWSCGVILYLLLSGIPPFNGDTEEEILKRVSTGKYDFKAPEWDLVSDQAMDLIKRMLAFNPQERCSAEEALKDPWFKLILGEETLDKPLAISALTNLKHFRLERKLQKAVWMMMVECLASKEEKAELLKTFQALDLNGDGQLSREELLNGYKNIMDSKDPEADVDEILKCVDNNHSGTIDYTEFVIATVNRRKMLNKEKLETLFKLFDKDGDGFLSANELEQAFNPGKLRPVEQKVWCELLSEFDINGDGKISLSEFRDMMSKIESL